MLNKLKSLREEHEDGFTLIELLVVILIIGILASIAIPVFLNQRQTANDAAVKSDVRNIAVSIETAIIDNPNAAAVRYDGTRVCAVATSTTACPANAPVVKTSEGVTVAVNGSANAYTVSGYHANGKNYKSGTPLVYNSTAGGLTN